MAQQGKVGVLKTSPGHETGDQDPGEETGDRSDVRQKCVRLKRARTGFELGLAGGRQPFMPHEYLTMPVFESYPFVFADCEADAAAFRRAR
jgi:hypothetical protein